MKPMLDPKRYSPGTTLGKLAGTLLRPLVPEHSRHASDALVEWAADQTEDSDWEECK